MKALAVIVGLASVIVAPILLFGATIALLSLVDVYAQTLGYGQD